MYAFEIVENPNESRTEYWFTTDRESRFYAFFITARNWVEEGLEGFPLLNNHGYVFGFYPIDEDADSSKVADPKIGPTICAIIRHFMSNFSQVVLIYHCESTDGKQQARNRKFQSWFKKQPALDGVYTDHINIEVTLPLATKKEYLGYFACCNASDAALIDAEFRQMAQEKVQSAKLVTD